MTDLHLDDPRDTLKMIRETLCVAQSAVGVHNRERIQRMINEIDRQRPLGPDGKHGDRHTATCGCEKPITVVAKAAYRSAVAEVFGVAPDDVIMVPAVGRAIEAVIDAVRPFVAANALRAVASGDGPFLGNWRDWLDARADAIERGEVQRCGNAWHQSEVLP